MNLGNRLLIRNEVFAFSCKKGIFKEENSLKGVVYVFGTSRKKIANAA